MGQLRVAHRSTSTVLVSNDDGESAVGVCMFPLLLPFCRLTFDYPNICMPIVQALHGCVLHCLGHGASAGTPAGDTQPLAATSSRGNSPGPGSLNSTQRIVYYPRP